MDRAYVDAPVALAGGICLIFGAFYAFGFGIGLVLLGIILLSLSFMEFTKSVVLTKDEKEVARICWPYLSVEDAYKMYAKNLVQLEREGHIIRKELGVREQFVLKAKSIYATYLLNYSVTSRNVKTILMDAYQRIQKIRIRKWRNWK